jgi:O-antigen ligase
VTIFLKKIENKFRLYKIIVFSILLSLAYVSIVQVTSNNNYVNFAIQRTLSTFPKLSDCPSLDTSEIVIVENPYIHDTIVSDQLRSTIFDELYVLIRKSPIWGNGFGSSVVSRPDGLVEYFFLDLLAKTGVIGLIIYILPFCFILIRICNNHYKDKYLMITLFSGLIAFFVASYFNPYMNSALGITYYIFVISVDQIQIKNN